MTQHSILMCAPEHFGVDYVINPWMKGQCGLVDKVRAQAQWKSLVDTIKSTARVVLIPPQEGLPDMVFTANAALLHGRRAVVSRFRHPERQGEESYFDAWFAAAGYSNPEGLRDAFFEGAGDALFSACKTALWMGHGHRSDAAAGPLLSEMLGITVRPLRLVLEEFYHLDTCFCPLDNGHLLYYPPAFDDMSLKLIADFYPEQKRIAVDHADARLFACNAVSLGDRVIVHPVSTHLRTQLNEAGYQVAEVNLDEFHKSGGSAKCLTLRLPM
ncbi:arginine deiminase-related protein [Xanthomonas hydrangeae]|uniref:arginine deiminase n=1 Tax=Xanthomonas hydrangeae TaxID=2775159 RepID=A0AAU0B994_9XANT|nr:arginine deiminase-related protein [Xanthomonas hydrangeae]WOB47948.1 arginine deiminase-related protein [Xanthomonas hydrangeae]